jgi:rRNA-processing protein FCF1
MIFEKHIRLEEELTRLLGSYKIFIIQSIKDELCLLEERGVEKQRIIAKSALSLIDRYNTIEGEKMNIVDDSLLKTAVSLSAFVVTNDKDLRKKLNDLGIKTICLRGDNHLMIS